MRITEPPVDEAPQWDAEGRDAHHRQAHAVETHDLQRAEQAFKESQLESPRNKTKPRQ